MLGKIHRIDAAMYCCAQFAGGVAGVVLAYLIAGAALALPPVSFAVTVPGAHGVAAAFMAEVLISAILMGVTLHASNQPRLMRAGARETYRGALVIVACGAVNSAALLLRSASPQHPNGLANGADVVGRHYMRHNNSAFMAISRHRNDTVFQKTLAINDYYANAPDSEFPLGHIQMLGKSHGDTIKGELPGWLPFKPDFALQELAQHSVDFWLTSEDLPDPDNRVTLDAQGGIVLSCTPNNMEGHLRLREKLKAALDAMDLHPHLLERRIYLGQDIPIGGTAHQNGTIRFGRDPRTSALDTNCEAHELDNLYVVDGSFFVSCGAVNPSLTIIANALRVGQHLRGVLG